MCWLQLKTIISATCFNSTTISREGWAHPEHIFRGYISNKSIIHFHSIVKQHEHLAAENRRHPCVIRRESWLFLHRGECLNVWSQECAAPYFLIWITKDKYTESDPTHRFLSISEKLTQRQRKSSPTHARLHTGRRDATASIFEWKWKRRRFWR